MNIFPKRYQSSNAGREKYKLAVMLRYEDQEKVLFWGQILTEGEGRGHKAPKNGVWRWGDKLGRTQWGRTAAGGRFTFRTGFLRVKSRLVSLRASCYSWLRNRASPRGCSPSDGIRHPFTACWMWGTRHWGGTGKARSPETEDREARDPPSSPRADQHSS